ncbi:MAG: hypothetical protein C4558_08025 [Dehalococcoidia bacterium]|nr:MAG: hypothetical protein C4558_08025 [Dehalococcoidia bacterium]
MADHNLLLILAQGDDWSWGRLLVVVGFVVLAMLNKIVEWLRSRSAEKTGRVDEEGYIILDPTADSAPPARPRSVSPRPVARAAPQPTGSASAPPARRERRVAPPRPARSPATMRSDSPPIAPPPRPPSPLHEHVPSTAPVEVPVPPRPVVETRRTSAESATRQEQSPRPKRRSAKTQASKRRLDTPAPAPPSLEEHHLITSIKEAAAPRLAVGSELLSDIRELSPDELRRAILLREVIGPPLSLRDDVAGW